MTPTDPVYSITSCYSTALHSIDTVVAVLPVSRLFFFSSHSIFTLFLSHAAAMFFHILYICVLESFPRFSPFFSFSSFLFLSLSLSLSPVIHCDFARPRKSCCLLFKGEQNDRNGNCFVSYSVPDIKTYCPICVLSIRIYYI